ncbi:MULTISPECIES: hypothetical protein [Bacillus]|uniref:Uncharacterized protein n=2 Tax=Bacillus TaxID=1386 RepID=A0A0M4FNJ5_9BACI|nr:MULTISPECIES: hypothetical protein [Bacillus]ALC80460.1 hypothetical protein AM592_01825 [Bacillus gobiensis]MBP1083523.1 hypothetical protein [Bacillus capparidis]MED1094721.1 hypothetical protein [Bacillus capparidis]
MKKFLKVAIVFAIVFSLFNTSMIGESKKAEACYPAYKCMSNTSLPDSYKLYYQNPDRRPGSFAGGVVVGGLGFFGGTIGAVAAFLGGTAYSYREIFYGNMSFKQYIKRSPVKGKKFRIKTVYYEFTNYRGNTTTKVRDEN